MSFLHAADLTGVLVFAVSGAIAGRRKEMDLFGCFVLAVVTCVGGGTLRSLMIGVTPPPVLVDPSYLGLAAGAVLIAIFGEKIWDRWQRAVSIFDAVGLGVFVCIGVQVSQGQGLAWWACVAMGVVTSSFGGVIRDLLRAEVPLLFRREIYATAAILGGLCYLGCEALGLGSTENIIVTTVVTASIRLLAIRFNWHLPA